MGIETWELVPTNSGIDALKSQTEDIVSNIRGPLDVNTK